MKEKKRTRGRPEHDPSARDRAQVKMLAAMGIPQADIARVVGVSQRTLTKHYKAELETGGIEANAKVAQSLFKQATDPQKPNVAAGIFWLKTRAGWREKDPASSPGEVAAQPGKKEQANLDARNAEAGTEWDGLLPPSGNVTPLRKVR